MSEGADGVPIQLKVEMAPPMAFKRVSLKRVEVWSALSHLRVAGWYNHLT